MTYYIEDLKPGLAASLSKTVTEHDIALFGEISGDTNPVHFDEEFARSTIFKGRIAPGALCVSYVSAVLGTKLPGPGTIFMNMTYRFTAPVRIGDRVTATCTVRDVVPEKRRATLDCICKVGSRVVVEGEALVMAPTRPKS